MSIPTGPERKVELLGGAAIDGAPVAYIVVLAVVIAVLAFVPGSVILSSGGTFPLLSQGVYPLMGWILGPVAGAVACGVGSLVGVFLAPHTAGIPVVSVWGAIVAGFAAGCLGLNPKRRYWWIPLTVLFVVEYLLFAGRAVVQNGVSVYAAVAGSILDWSGILLFALPTRALFGRWINSRNLAWVAVGLFCGTWMIAGVWHVSTSFIVYFMQNWPEKIWLVLVPVVPFENLVRCLTGAVIGSGVIAGLRAIGLVKPADATY
jgi:hypothetical protein